MWMYKNSVEVWNHGLFACVGLEWESYMQALAVETRENDTQRDDQQIVIYYND